MLRRTWSRGKFSAIFFETDVDRYNSFQRSCFTSLSNEQKTQRNYSTPTTYYVDRDTKSAISSDQRYSSVNRSLSRMKINRKGNTKLRSEFLQPLELDSHSHNNLWYQNTYKLWSNIIISTLIWINCVKITFYQDLWRNKTVSYLATSIILQVTRSDR